MNRHIYILFDVPDNKNDKEWLIEGLKDYYGDVVSSVSINHILSEMIMLQGGWHRIYAYLIIIKQCLKTLLLSRQDDIIICWFSTTGKIFNFLSRIFGNRQYILAMNWLNPGIDNNDFHSFLAKYTLSNPKCIIVVNTNESPRLWRDFAGKDCNGFVVMPDVFDDSVPFITPTTKRNDRYCFSGGYGNRDWRLLMNVASLSKSMKFVCVAKKDDFQSKVEIIPDNVEIYYNIEQSEYYNLMQGSSLVLLPLVGNTISGLVNIIRAAQLGIICSVSRTIATEQYYAEENNDLLIESNEQSWADVINKIMTLTDKEYIDKAISYQQYIKQQFSPQNAVSILVKTINRKFLEA